MVTNPESLEKRRKMLSDKMIRMNQSRAGIPLSEERRKKISDNAIGKKHPHRGSPCPENKRIKISKSVSKSVSGEKNPFYGRKHKKETIKKLSAAVSGEKHPRWQGGISFKPYCHKFTFEFKERVRNFFGRVCVKCGKTEKENGQRLDVHHVNYDKMVCCNGVKPLFVALCRTHNAQANSNREYWNKYYTKTINEKYNGQCYLPKITNEGENL